MHQNTLKQIANVIFINIQQQENLGFLNGKAGIALFLYDYARYANNLMYSELADELLDQIYESLSKQVNKNFFSGLAGIAYVVDYIIKNKFVETDEDDGDVLDEIDSELSQMNEADFLLDLESDLPLFSKGLYFLQRKNKYSLSKIAEECFAFLFIHKQKVPLSYINSVLFFVNKASRFEEIGVLYEILTLLCSRTYSILLKKDYTESDIYALNKNIENIKDVFLRNKWIDIVVGHDDLNVSMLDKSWVNLVYRYDVDNSLDGSKMQKTLNNIMLNLTDDELNIYNGLAGLGLELIKLSRKND